MQLSEGVGESELELAGNALRFRCRGSSSSDDSSESKHADGSHGTTASRASMAGPLGRLPRLELYPEDELDPS